MMIGRAARFFVRHPAATWSTSWDIAWTADGEGAGRSNSFIAATSTVALEATDRIPVTERAASASSWTNTPTTTTDTDRTDVVRAVGGHGCVDRIEGRPKR